MGLVVGMLAAAAVVEEELAEVVVEEELGAEVVVVSRLNLIYNVSLFPPVCLTGSVWLFAANTQTFSYPVSNPPLFKFSPSDY